MTSHDFILRKPTATALLMVGAAMMLQGCVAAIPLAAGGLMARSTFDPNDRDPATAAPIIAARPTVTQAPVPAQTPTQAPTKVSTSVGAKEPEPQTFPEQRPSMAVASPPEQAGLAAGRAETLNDSADTQASGSSNAGPSAKPGVAEMVPPRSVTPSSQSATSTSALTETGNTVERARDAQPEQAMTTPPPVSIANDSGFADAYRVPDRANSTTNLTSSEAAAAALATRRATPMEMPPPQTAPEPAPPTSPRPDAAAAAASTAPVEPAISATTRSVTAQRTSPAPNAVTQLLSYANQRQFVSGQNRMSAMLADRISLEPKRAQCGGVKPAVLIDLDPQGGIFEPTQASNPPAGLGAGLSQLRAQGIQIAWISSNPDERSNLIRRALTRSGLDIHGRDTVLLIRKDDERKQTLREEFAKTYCLIAIAGDARSDFDELYDYLLDPSEAATLEPLYGEGWFIIPQPLVPQGS